MAIAEIELPDGRIAEVEIPDGMDMRAAQAQLQSMYESGAFGQAAPQQSPEAPPKRSQDWRSRADAMIPNWASEFASGFNRAATQAVDFVGGLDAINAGLRLAGSDKQIPTLTQGLDAMGGQGGFMEQGPARDVVRAGGALTTAAAGMVPIARQAGTVASTVADLVGAGSSAITQPVREAADYTADLYRRSMPQNPFTKSKREQARLPLLRKAGTSDSFGFQFDPSTGRVVPDPKQAEAAKQGVDERVVTMVRDAPAKAREKMRQILDVVDRSRIDARYAAGNRPGDIIGDSITARTRTIYSANRAAGQQLDKVAESLKGKPVDVQPAINDFLETISDMGIRFDPSSNTVSYAGSDIEGLEGPIKALNRTLSRLYNSGKPADAYDVHRMKRWIDENVTYGKAGEGLSGKMERVLKGLRRALDSTLDQSFPEYNRVNTAYSDTIGALDALQEAAGKRIDLTGKNAETALGTLSRRMLGNQVSRQQLVNALEQADDTARRVLSGDYAGSAVVPFDPARLSKVAGVSLDDLDDDLVAQVSFVSELEKIFGTNASNSFLGDIAKATDRSVESLAVGDKTGPIREGARMAINKVRGINEENALKALRELLKD